MVVDCHVHTRDLEEAHKETIKRALLVARESGVDGIFAMPNTKPPLTDEEIVIRYHELAEQAGVEDVFFGIYLALTKDIEQVKRAVDLSRKFPWIVGFKMYWGESTMCKTMTYVMG